MNVTWTTAASPPWPAGTVYADLNNDHTLAPGNPSATTDASGNYVLLGLPTGANIPVRVIALEGWQQSVPRRAAAQTAFLTDAAPVASANSKGTNSKANSKGITFISNQFKGDPIQRPAMGSQA